MNKRIILIIDDEERIRTIYARIFKAVGNTIFEVILTPSANSAMEYLINRQIDLVLLDIRMPNVDGSQMAKIIKTYNPKIKVIIASVYPIDKQRQMVPNAQGYYDKSQGPLKLLEKVTSVLG